MPIYEFECNKCSETFELLLKFNENNKIQKCPKCKKNSKRKYHGNRTGLNFIGNWYKTTQSY